jgi:hypothetical protein
MRTKTVTTRGTSTSPEHDVRMRDTKGELGQQPNSSSPSKLRFKSVLTQPFSHWNDIEDVIAEFMTEWSPSERSSIIQNLIRFLELKVILEEYESKKLLAPTQLVGHAWHVLILETELYRDVTIAVQEFHARPRRMIHHTLLRRHEKAEFEQRLKRTQRLFKAYYGAEMPGSLKEISGMGSMYDPLASETGSDGIRDDAPKFFWESVPTLKMDPVKPWYFPWLPQTCDCMEAFRDTVFWSSRDDICVDEDLDANIDENVSLLTPPDIAPGE